MSRKTAGIIWSVCCLLMLAFLLVSLFLAPFSPEHGYIVGSAKLMAQGLAPWHDFHIMDLPLGIWLVSLPYRITGVLASGNVAVALMAVVHLLNLGLLWKNLSVLDVRYLYRWVSLLFYLLVLYSTQALEVSLFPLAVMFLLLCLPYCRKHTKQNLFMGGFFFTLAVLCKVQVLVLLPAIWLYICLPGQRPKWHTTQLIYFLVACFTWMMVAAMVVFLISDESAYWNHIIPNVHLPYLPGWRPILQNFLILAGRCSVYFLLVGIVAARLLDKLSLRVVWVAILAFVCVAVYALFDNQKGTAQLLYPFLTLAFAMSLQSLVTAQKGWWALFLSCLLLPAFLTGREFLKLENGSQKELQQAYFNTLGAMVTKTASVAMLQIGSTASDLGCQIYAEVPHLQPFDLKRTRWGLNDWGGTDETYFITSALEEADYIMVNSEFLQKYHIAAGRTHGLWDESFSRFLQERESFSLGGLQIFPLKEHDKDTH